MKLVISKLLNSYENIKVNIVRKLKLECREDYEQSNVVSTLVYLSNLSTNAIITEWCAYHEFIAILLLIMRRELRRLGKKNKAYVHCLVFLIWRGICNIK